MAENLNSSKFLKGEDIPQAKTLDEWNKASENGRPAWCYYDNRSIQDDPVNGSKYGKLYNWYAVNDRRVIAPKGWHIPTDDEWTMLSNALGGTTKSGSKLKASDSWTEKLPTTLKSGFNALPSGMRYDGGLPVPDEDDIDSLNEDFTSQENGFDGLAVYAVFWSSNDQGYGTAIIRECRVNTNTLKRDTYAKQHSYSVRCVKN